MLEIIAFKKQKKKNCQVSFLKNYYPNYQKNLTNVISNLIGYKSKIKEKNFYYLSNSATTNKILTDF